MTSPFFFVDRQRLVAVALDHRLPSMFAFRQWVDEGGLMSYGASLTDMNRLAADYVDRIAKGAKPADFAGAAADQIRAYRQPQDRAGARPDDLVLDPRPRRRGHRVTRAFLAPAFSRSGRADKDHNAAIGISSSRAAATNRLS
jgi:hypothetical protein